MPRQTLAIRIDADKRQALDDLARAVDRDRSYLINEAIDHYLALNEAEISLIRERLAEAEASEQGLPHAEVFRKLNRSIGKARKSPRRSRP